MTRAEAEAALLAAYPGKTVWLECLRTNHSHYSPRQWTTTFRVSVHNGLDAPEDARCEGFDGDTLEKVMVKALEGRQQPENGNLFFHPEASQQCDHCGQPFRGEAGQSTADTVLCPPCVAKAQHTEQRDALERKNALAAALERRPDLKDSATPAVMDALAEVQAAMRRDVLPY